MISVNFNSDCSLMDNAGIGGLAGVISGCEMLCCGQYPL